MAILPEARDSDRIIVEGLWALAMVVTFLSGTDPGFVPNRFAVPYPWWPVVRTCLIITLELVVLYLFLRRASKWVPWKRAAIAAGVSALLFLALSMGMRTDQAGWAYANQTCCGLAALVLIAYALGLRREDRASPNQDAA